MSEKYKVGYCSSHHWKYKKYGDPLARGKNDPNEIIVKSTHAEMLLYRDCQEIGRALIDIDDIERVSQHTWYLDSDGYVKSNTCKERKLHRFITSAPKGKLVDHRNRVRHDNRKSNLFICTHNENNKNTGKRNDNKSGVTGVRLDKSNNKWRAVITYNKKQIHLGYFTEFEQAVEARLSAEQKYFNRPKGEVI